MKLSLEVVGSEELHINNLDLKTPITFFFFFQQCVSAQFMAHAT